MLNCSQLLPAQRSNMLWGLTSNNLVIETKWIQGSSYSYKPTWRRLLLQNHTHTADNRETTSHELYVSGRSAISFSLSNTANPWLRWPSLTHLRSTPSDKKWFNTTPRTDKQGQCFSLVCLKNTFISESQQAVSPHTFSQKYKSEICVAYQISCQLIWKPSPGAEPRQTPTVELRRISHWIWFISSVCFVLRALNIHWIYVGFFFCTYYCEKCSRLRRLPPYQRFLACRQFQPRRSPGHLASITGS